MKAKDAAAQLKALASPEVAASSARFFKTGPGEYGEGDLFIGVRVPTLRKLARDFRDLPLAEIELLLRSHIHEERMLALLVLVLPAGKCSESHRKSAYDLYLSNTTYINNWDLIDSSAPAIVGGYLRDKDRKPLQRLAKSKNMWERRIAMIATQHFIRLRELLDGDFLVYSAYAVVHCVDGWDASSGF